MEVDVEENVYVRNLDDVKSIIKYAKLNEKNLTTITQAIYYPSDDITFDNYKLLELDKHLHGQIQNGQTIQFKGGLNEKAVLCTEEKTYEVKAAEISNSLLLVPDFKFGQATSTSPLKSPKGGNTSLERSLNDSGEEDLDIARSLERRDVLKVFHEYFECREIQPRFRKLSDLLQLTRFSGPENEFCTDKKLLFTFNQLLDTTQCSKNQFIDGLKKIRAIKIGGHMRVLEYDYEYRIINLMIGLITENSWDIKEIDKEITIESLEGIAPQEVVENLFDLYTIPSDEHPGKFQYKEDMVARIVAQNILQPGLKFQIDEFLATWQDALPDGMIADVKYLRGLGIIDKDSPSPCIRSLAEDNLSTNLQERLKILFKTKTRWTLEDIEPYLDYFVTPTLAVTTILSKYTRSLAVNGQRVFVAKHA